MLPPLLATEKPPEPAFILGSGHNEKNQTFLVTFQSSNGEGKHLLGRSFKKKQESATRTCRKHPETTDISGSTNIAGWKMEHLKMSFLLKMGIFHRMILWNSQHNQPGIQTAKFNHFQNRTDL